jgi:quinoprotein glucose dehydrogenase
MQPIMKHFSIALAAACLIGAGLAAQNARQQIAGGDWVTYAGDLAGTKYSAMADINTGNVARLTQAWNVRLTAPAGRRGGGAPPTPGVAGEVPQAGRFGEGAAAAGGGADAPNAGGRQGRGGAGAGGGVAAAVIDPSGVAQLGSNPEATPIAVNGIVYLPAAGNSVLAIDGATGKEVWKYALPAGSATTARGVAYWPGEGGTAARIIFSGGPKLFALDAATGQPAKGFGADGSVDITVPWNGVPLIYRHLVMLGATTGEIPDGPRGDTRAFDARTGARLWEFHTVPRPGELGHDSWLNEGWKDRSGVNVWTWSMTLDAERGILYMPVAGPAANYWGGDRPGNNLFANSIVAVDATTGKYKWHFQTVHHDLWDSDMSNPPTLVDITQNGRRIPALAFVGKTGWMFILDRTNGKPIFGVEERKVPAGNAPGEWYSPTQPFPLKPGPLVRVDFKKERDLVRAEDTSADHVAACEALIESSGGFYNAGPFTPFVYHEDGTPPKSSIQFPGGTGGVNWGGAAADPRSGFVYVNAHDTSLVGWIEKKKPGGNYGRGTEGSKQPYDRASISGPGPYASFSAPMKTADGRSVSLPCHRPPWGELVAVNTNNGEIAWRTPLGINDSLPAGRQNVGGTGSAGPMTTAGGLVFVGATTDRRFRAFDAKTGKELWSTQLPATVNANPMSYRGKDGKQYVAFIATDSLIAFALPN